jgi:hypothetical protein
MNEMNAYPTVMQPAEVRSNTRPHVRNGTRKLQQPHLERARLGKSKGHSDGLKQLRDQAIRAGLIEAPQIGPANMASSAMTTLTTVPAVIPFSAAPVETRAICQLRKIECTDLATKRTWRSFQMIVGESSPAIPTLTQLLQTPYYGTIYSEAPITPALLRLDPIWDPLRADPRFQKLCEEKQP